MSNPRRGQDIPLGRDLIAWASGRIGEFPRKHWFRVGDRLMTRQLVRSQRVGAQCRPGARGAALRSANIALGWVRYNFRLSRDLRWLSIA